MSESTGPSSGSGRGDSRGDWKPVPDPSILTTEQLRRELAALRELLESRIDAMERATDLRLGESNRIPQDISATANQIRQLHDKDISHVRDMFGERDFRFDQAKTMTEQSVKSAVIAVDELRKLHDEKFVGIDKQFVERDVRTTQASGAADDALKAALQAAKELVGAQGEASAAAAVKSETSFTKQIDQIGTIIQTLEKALDARITELKERIDRGEGSASGASTAHIDTRQNLGVVVAIAGLIVTIIAVAFAIISTVHK